MTRTAWPERSSSTRPRTPRSTSSERTPPSTPGRTAGPDLKIFQFGDSRFCHVRARTAATYSQLLASFQDSLSRSYVVRVRDPIRTKEAGNGSDRSRIPPQVEEVAGHLPGRRRGCLPDRVPRVLQPRGRRRRVRLLRGSPDPGQRGGGTSPRPPLPGRAACARRTGRYGASPAIYW